MNGYDVDQLIALNQDVLQRLRNADINDLSIMKDLNCEYSRIQIQIKTM